VNSTHALIGPHFSFQHSRNIDDPMASLYAMAHPLLFLQILEGKGCASGDAVFAL